jgi:hypothetical protein
MNKRTHSVSERDRTNRSLHGSFRKRQLENIEIENARLLKRLQERRSDYQVDKMKEDWKKQKAVIKNIANYPLVIKDGGKSQKRRTFHKPISLDFNRNLLTGAIELVRMRNIDGVNMIVTITLDEHQLTISGDPKINRSVKIIEIPREEAMEFIEEECEGKI